mgnify:CR=1 FL=1
MIELKCETHFDYCKKAIRLCEFIRGDTTLDNHKIDILAYVMSRWEDRLLNADNIEILARHFNRSVVEMQRIRKVFMDIGYITKSQRSEDGRKYIYKLHKNLLNAARYKREVFNCDVRIQLSFNT